MVKEEVVLVVKASYVRSIMSLLSINKVRVDLPYDFTDLGTHPPLSL